MLLGILFYNDVKIQESQHDNNQLNQYKNREISYDFQGRVNDWNLD